MRSTSPTTPMTVRSSPTDRNASRPCSSMLRLTPSTSCCVADGRMTTIIRLPPLPLIRRSAHDRRKQKTQELSLPASAGTSACAGEIYSPASYPLAVKPHLGHWCADSTAEAPPVSTSHRSRADHDAGAARRSAVRSLALTDVRCRQDGSAAVHSPDGTG